MQTALRLLISAATVNESPGAERNGTKRRLKTALDGGEKKLVDFESQSSKTGREAQGQLTSALKKANAVAKGKSVW
jgi:hypothetical protein